MRQILLSSMSRVFLSAFFIISSIHKIFYWQDAERKVMRALYDWQLQLNSLGFLQPVLAEIVSWASICLIVATLCELVGGLMLLLNTREKLGASILFVVLFCSTMLFHPFWFFEHPTHHLALHQFFKNFSVLGGLLLSITAKKRENEVSFSSSSYLS